jgi:hypothetical protein
MPAARENLASLEDSLGGPPLAVVPWLKANSPRARAVGASRHLGLDDVRRALLSG